MEKSSAKKLKVRFFKSDSIEADQSKATVTMKL